MLQGLCGLRIYEAAYLREQDFDPGMRTISVSESAAHKPKTRYSYRTLPICDSVAQVLGKWVGQLKVRHPEGYLFLPSRVRLGRGDLKSPEARAGALTMDTVKHYWSRSHSEARNDGVSLPEHFIPRKLRASFTTTARRAGADFELLEAYIGHSPKSILAAHYDHVDVERLRPIAQIGQRIYDGTDALAAES